MKAINTLLVFVVAGHLYCMGALPISFIDTEVTVTVSDDSGQTLEGVDVILGFSNLGAEGGLNYDKITQRTDESGVAVIVGKGPYGIHFHAEKEGYYQYGYGSRREDTFRQNQMPRKIEHEIILRKQENPKPLYVKYKGGGEIPNENEWAGYDLEKGDWVRPHGRGETVDILFRYQNEFRGIRELASRTIEERRAIYQRKCDQKGIPFTEEGFMQAIGKWDGSYQIAFPSEKEGIIRVEADFIPESILPMPNDAPETGYLEEYNELLSYEDSLRFEKELGFFLRTRVVLDERGEIESANYTKIHGDFRFSTITGYIEFNYYYNPGANDRNLEYSGENLFPKGTPGTRGITGYR